MNKSRIDQDAEIRFYFEPYANKGCKECFGTAKAGWLEYLGDVKISQYKICNCVMKNIKNLAYRQAGKQKKEVVN